MRDIIISEIRRIAEANGGQPPGVKLFRTETGIGEAKWRGVYWARWSDALIKAGYASNQMQSRLDSKAILYRLAELARQVNRVPTYSEMRLHRRSDPALPNDRTIANHFGTMAGLVDALRSLSQRESEFADIAALLPEQATTGASSASKEGWVYLLKSGQHYKIGRSDQLETRVKKISIALPEATAMVHAIRTDDPPGIESYWHRRFADRRANGEWFKLSAADVAAFSRRKFQ